MLDEPILLLSIQNPYEAAYMKQECNEKSRIIKKCDFFSHAVSIYARRQR
jgi:hypothetical protein